MSSFNKRSVSSRFNTFGFIGVIVLLIAFLVGIFVAESAIVQWFWNDFLVTHTHSIFARTSLTEAMLPTLIINMMSGYQYRSKKD